jgi:nucleoside-diphosphate-sugar epimerase/glyoxylase-like metal-dependent hydrolase (beta-lactamase superfamily II)
MSSVPAVDDRPVLVTGATGFLGGRLARALLARGVPVRATGRNLERGLALQAEGADFRPVDLDDPAATREVCRGVRAVVHCGARATPWGPREAFEATNVRGTEAIIAGCLAHRVERLVHISSSSVTNRFQDQFDLDESAPYPEEHVSEYSRSKRIAEERVRAAVAQGLSAVILRPRAIYGPGDEVLLPRLLRVAAKGRLPQIGDGKTIINLVFVDDMVDAALLAVDAPAAVGQTYVITHPEPIRFAEMLDVLLRGLDLPRPSRQISAGTAMGAARTLAGAWRWLALPGEPPLTPYTVSVLAWSQTFRIDAARRDLGFEPKVSWREGVQRVIAHLRKPERASTPRPRVRRVERAVRCDLLEVGATQTFARAFFDGEGLAPLRAPSRVACLDHPDEGVVLFDTGYSTRFLAAGGLGAAAYRTVTPVQITEEENAVEQLRARGVNPEDVRWIVLSHFDPDHYGGLRDFPRARIVVAAEAWAAARQRPGLALRGVRLIPELIPGDLSARLQVVTTGELTQHEGTLDLFGDGAVRLVSLPGHSPGQIGAFVHGDGTPDVLLAADACWTTRGIDTEQHSLHRWLAVDRAAQDRTYRWLKSLRREHPDLCIVPTHCPDIGRTACDHAH